MPSARMDERGNVRAGISTLDPYAHSFLSFQLAEPLSVVLRQSAEISSLRNDAARLYPGMDLKFRTIKETRSRPAIAIGLQSAIGHKRMAGEYIAASKRYKNFDFTGGMGWGRYASAKHFDNPLSVLGSHFDKTRALDGELPTSPSDWFTGEHIGLFAGVEYFTPWDGLSLKFDYGADRYAAESTAFGFDVPAPWSAGINYKPKPWVDIGVAAQGVDKIMARLSFQGNVKNWRDQDAQDIRAEDVPFRPYRTGLALPSEMEVAAAGEDIILHGVNADNRRAAGYVELHGHASTPRQMARAAKHMANHAGTDIEEILLTPTRLGLRGPNVGLMRRDLEHALAKHNASTQEIWQNTSFTPTTGKAFHKHARSFDHGYGVHDINLTLKTQASLAEEDSGVLYRTSLIAETQAPSLFGWIDNFFGVRVNLADNLEALNEFRPLVNPRSILPVRANVDEFAAQTFAIDTAYSAFTHSFRSDLHLSLMGGYLEEMYAGFGGEILYRPFDARWAVGAESFMALKRDPLSGLNLQMNGDHVLTAHVNGWYDIPALDLTLGAKVGRYLAEDFGATLSLGKTFDNGAKLEGYITVSDAVDFDLFGGVTHADHGVRLSLPLGGYKYVPRGVKADTSFAPFGRDIGQSLDNPLPLYVLTEGFSLRHMADHWGDITP